MRFFKLGVTIVFLMSCLFISEAFAADVAKIGIIDIQQILTTSDAGKIAQGKIAAKGKELEAELKSMGTAIEEDKARYEREAAVMSKEARSEKERELKIKILDFQDLETRYKANFSAYNQELVTKFKLDILSVVNQIGKKEGFLLILEKRESGVVYAPETIEITDKIIQQYNETFSKKENE